MKYVSLAALALLVSPGICRAQMPWQEIIQTAMENNPRLSSARQGLKSAEYSLKGRGADFLPRFSASAEAGMVDEDFSRGFSGSLTLFSANLKDITALRRARVSVEREKESYRRTVADVMYGLKSAYASLLSVREEVELAKEVLARRRENSEIVSLRYEAGREDRGAQLRAQADLARAEMNLSSSQREFEIARVNLLKEMGLDEQWGEREVEGEMDMGEIPFEPDIYSLAEKTPEYRIRKLDLERARYDHSMARSNYLHNISLSASQSYRADEFDFGQGEWTTRLSLSVPFTYDLRNTYSLERAGLEIERARQQLRGERMERVSFLKSLFASLKDARERISVQEKYFNATRVRAEIAREEYLNGLISYQEWNMIENDYMGALNAVLDAQRRAYTAFAAWQRALGEY